MRDGHCPKCDSNDVHVSALKIPLPAYSFINAFPVSWSFWSGLSSVPLKTYICIRCGYIESYVENHEKLQEIAAKLPRVHPT